MKRATVNQRAVKEMKKYCVEHEINSCELHLPGCHGNYVLTFAHRHKRRWYYDKPVSRLWERSEWRLACLHCHQLIEYDSDLLERIWMG